jgi:hypothetical protein
MEINKTPLPPTEEERLHNMEHPMGELLDMAELIASGEWQKTEHEIRSRIEIDKLGVTLYFRYEYFIDWERLETPEHLLQWVTHLTEKSWMDNLRMRFFIEAVCQHKGWKAHS